MLAWSNDSKYRCVNYNITFSVIAFVIEFNALSFRYGIMDRSVHSVLCLYFIYLIPLL